MAPGALLLDEAVSLLLSQGPGARLAQVVTFKFLSPVRPGDQVDVYRETVRSDTVTLCCAVAGVTALRGTLRLAVA